MRARRASGGREGELVKRASKLRGSVGPLLPKLVEGCPADRFDALRAELEAVRESRDDEGRLERLVRRGEPLARAYAGLLKFYLKPELPGVLVAPFPGGEISFAPLARTPREFEIAVQYSEYPRRRLLGYLHLARKGYHFFADDTELYCTGRSPKPPAEFLRGLAARLPYRVEPRGDSGRFECPHLLRDEPVAALRVDWPDAGRSFAVCRRCAKGDRQLLASLTEGLAVPRPEATFPVSVSLNVDCRAGEACLHAALPDLPRGIRRRYLFGKYSDAEALDAYREAVRPALERSREPIFVAAGVCHGADQRAFVTALAPTAEERAALEGALPEVRGLFEVDEAKASRALERLWPQHADRIVAAIEPDPARAQALVREARSSPGRVSELLHRAARSTRERRVLDELPRYDGLVAEAGYVDAIARAFRARGPRAAEKLLLERLPREGKERGLAFGLLLAMGQAPPHVWQFTDTERQFGEALLPNARPVLEAPAAAYDRALTGLLAAAGVAGWGRRLEGSGTAAPA